MKIFINVGDASADLYASYLIKELRRVRPAIEIFANGGPLMEKAGVKLLYNLIDFSVVGFSEAVKNYFKQTNIAKCTAEFIIRNKIDMVLLVDYPGFNLYLARRIKQLKIPIVYFIGPQIWAWGRGRIKKIKEFVRKMFVILPFEEKIYRESNVPVEFVGHPLLDIVKASKSKSELLKEFNIDTGKKVIGLFPGSRKQEVKRLLPVMMDAAKDISNCQLILGQSVTIPDDLLKRLLAKYNLKVKVVKGRTYDIMSICDCLIASSGTVTLEACLMEIPAIVVYKISQFSWILANKLVIIKYAALPNIIADKEVIPELLQNRATKENVLKHVTAFLEDKLKRQKVINELRKIKSSLGSKWVFKRLAKGILNCRK